jgi:hypothetical protein
VRTNPTKRTTAAEIARTIFSEIFDLDALFVGILEVVLGSSGTGGMIAAPSGLGWAHIPGLLFWSSDM